MQKVIGRQPRLRVGEKQCDSSVITYPLEKNTEGGRVGGCVIIETGRVGVFLSTSPLFVMLKNKLISRYLLQRLAFIAAIGFAVAAFVGVSSVFAFTAATLFPGDETTVGGSLVRLSEGGDVAEISDTAYDENLLGVAVSPAPVVYRPSRNATGISVVESGVVSVLVSTLNGSINRGDFITSSGIAGIGQRADDLTRTVAGIAIDSFAGGPQTITYQGDDVSVGSIRVLLDIGPAMAGDAQSGGVETATSNFIDVFSEALRDLLDQPGGAALFFRYVVALLITLLAIFFSLQHFGRSALRGIEAIGRNPLARRYIQFTVALNVLLGVLMSAAAIIFSFLLLV